MNFDQGFLGGLALGLATAALLRPNLHQSGLQISKWSTDRLDVFGAVFSLAAFATVYGLSKVWAHFSAQRKAKFKIPLV